MDLFWQCITVELESPLNNIPNLHKNSSSQKQTHFEFRILRETLIGSTAARSTSHHSLILCLALPIVWDASGIGSTPVFSCLHCGWYWIKKVQDQMVLHAQWHENLLISGHHNFVCYRIRGRTEEWIGVCSSVRLKMNEHISIWPLDRIGPA